MRKVLTTRRKLSWGIAAAVAALWLTLLIAFGSAIGATVVLLIFAAFGGVGILALRSLGVTRDHPLVQSLASRPWRTGPEVFYLALRHLSELLIITPKGGLLAPAAVEVRMNPSDIEALAEVIDLDLATALAVESYEAEIEARSARVHRDDMVVVSVVADGDVRPGRYALRQSKQVPAEVMPGGAGARQRFTRVELDTARTLLSTRTGDTEADLPPLLRLVTGSAATQTRVSGARAGRSRTAELVLPDIPTISRLHARFTYASGEWRISGLGRNGIVVNGVLLSGEGEQAIHDGDMIRWGRHHDSPMSRVEIS